MLSDLSRRSRRVICAAVFVLPSVAALSLLGGCNGQEPITTGPSAETGGDQRSYCDGLLESLTSMVQPDRLGISSDAKSAADLMNEWVTRCAKKADADDLDAATTELAGDVLGQERLAQLADTRFVARDAAHLRNAILFRQISNFAGGTAGDDAARVTELFHYAMRNVALTDSGEGAQLPLSPYEIMLFGRGSAEDRAWMFAELLRQLRIDAVIVRPRAGEMSGDDEADGGEQSDVGDRWLIGVLLEDDVYLFDPRIGWPIPSPADDGSTPLVRKPATLAEVAEDPELLRRLDVDDEHKYPLSAEDLKAVRIELIAHDRHWAARMRQLQASLAGERAVMLYDGLGAAVERVADAGGSFWGRDDISIWPHPQQSIDGHARLEENQDQQLLVRLVPFQAPVPVKPNLEEQKLDFGRPQRQQLETRIAQLEGRYEDAIKSYQMIRISAGFPPQWPVPPEVRLMHARAADDAMYWVGLSQYELGDYSAAAETFNMYLRSPDAGPWEDESTRLRAECLARDGEYASAVKIITALSVRRPERAEYDLLARRWRALRDAKNSAQQPAQ